MTITATQNPVETFVVNDEVRISYSSEALTTSVRTDLYAQLRETEGVCDVQFYPEFLTVTPVPIFFSAEDLQRNVDAVVRRYFMQVEPVSVRCKAVGNPFVSYRARVETDRRLDEAAVSYLRERGINVDSNDHYNLEILKDANQRLKNLAETVKGLLNDFYNGVISQRPLEYRIRPTVNDRAVELVFNRRIVGPGYVDLINTTEGLSDVFWTYNRHALQIFTPNAFFDPRVVAQQVAEYIKEVNP